MAAKIMCVDDSSTIRMLVKKSLEPAGYEVLEAENGKEGLDKSGSGGIGMFIVDVNMPVMNGFEMLQHITYKSFEIIFTTAYDEYAIKAFKVNAIDYLLKPIDPEELVQAMEKVKEKIEKSEQYNKIDKLLKTLGQPDIKNKKVALSIDGKIKMIPFDSIIYCEAESNYTFIYLAQGKRVLLSKTLKEVEKIIDHPEFFRVQNSYLVNLNHIKEYIRGEGGDLIMSNGDEVRVSRKKKDELMKLLF